MSSVSPWSNGVWVPRRTPGGEFGGAHGARKSIAVLVLRHPYIGIEKVQCAGRNQPYLAGCVSRMQVAVGAKAIGIAFTQVETQCHRANAAARMQAHVLQIVGAARYLGVKAVAARLSAARDDVDHPAHGAVAVAHCTATANDLDAFYLRQRHRAQVGAGEIDLIEPDAVDQNQHIAAGRGAHAAHVDRGVLVVAIETLQIEVGLTAQQIDHRGGGGTPDVLRGDHRHAMRNRAQGSVRARRGDDHLGKPCDVIRLRSGQTAVGRDERGQQTQRDRAGRQVGAGHAFTPHAIYGWRRPADLRAIPANKARPINNIAAFSGSGTGVVVNVSIARYAGVFMPN